MSSINTFFSDRLYCLIATPKCPAIEKGLKLGQGAAGETHNRPSARPRR